MHVYFADTFGYIKIAFKLELLLKCNGDCTLSAIDRCKLYIWVNNSTFKCNAMVEEVEMLCAWSLIIR